jgi:hypothetical protein
MLFKIFIACGDRCTICGSSFLVRAIRHVAPESDLVPPHRVLILRAPANSDIIIKKSRAASFVHPTELQWQFFTGQKRSRLFFHGIF